MIASILLQLGGSWGNMIPLVLMVVVFYFFMIRPQMAKVKEQKKFVEALNVGEKVVTTAGIHGKIVSKTDVTVVLEVESGARIRFDKSAVSSDATKALTSVKA